ncbi:MAG: hypothetical protein FWD71_18085 [Oscillospiraceae bacterium]|nr:hypothetical protein [Oscillospiraceae bacterium]
MNWNSFWIIIGHISNILGILSVIISFGLWLSFGKFKKEIERQKIKYIEEQERILKNLTSIYESLFANDEKNDDVVSDLRKQIYSINKKFRKLMIHEDLKHIDAITKILRKDTDRLDFSGLRKDLDCIITAFAEKHYDD